MTYDSMVPPRRAPGEAWVSHGAEPRAVEAIESALLTLLQRHPDGVVFAISGGGVPKPAPVPGTIPLVRHQVAEGDGQLMDEVIPADRALVAKLWGQAHAQGAAVATVRRVSDPENPSNLYLLDVRHRHQVMVGLFTPGFSSDGDEIVEAARLPKPPPRLARALKDTSAVFTWVDPTLTVILGWAPEDLIGQRTLELVHPDDRELGIATWLEMLDSEDQSPPVRLRHRHRDGSWVWLEVTNQKRQGEGDEEVSILAQMLDVSDEMATIDALHAREQLLGQLTETVPVGLFHADLAGNLLFANRRLSELVGSPFGPRLIDQLERVDPEDRTQLEADLGAAAEGIELDTIVRIHQEGRTRHCSVSVRPLRDDYGTVTGLTGCVEDVTASVQSRSELEVKAISDPLTGCLNRAGTLAVLQDALDRAAAAADSGGTAAIFIDLDQFKPVNDQFGHATGDEVLLRVAERIRTSVRSGDVVGRLGGDEFLVICPNVVNPATALAIAGALTSRAFGAPIDLGSTDLEMRASLGVAWSDERNAYATALVAQADAAMYRSKREGRSEPVLFADPAA